MKIFSSAAQFKNETEIFRTGNRWGIDICARDWSLGWDFSKFLLAQESGIHALSTYRGAAL